MNKRTGAGPDLIERLCRALAVHVWESQLTLQFSDGDTDRFAKDIADAKALIVEAGFDFDELYPVSERPIAESAH